MTKFMYVLIIALLLSLVGTVAAQSGDVLFEANFNNGKMPADLDASQGWKVIKDGRDVVLHAETTDKAEVALVTSGTDWANYAYEMKFKLQKGSVLLTARVSGDQSVCNGYGVLVSSANQILSLLKLDDQCKSEVLDSVTKFQAVRDDWTTLRLEMSGTQLSVLVDNQPTLSASDETHTQGLPAMILLPDSEVEIDSLTFTALEGATVDNNPSGVSLTRFNGDSADAVAELEENGLVPAGGTLLFQEDNAFFKGAGNFFTPLARRSPHTNIVMAAEIAFTVGSTKEIETCTLLSRIKTNNQGTATTFVDIGLTNGGDLVVQDFSKVNAKATTFEIVPLKLDLSAPHHLMILMLGAELTVFIDGQVTLDKIAVAERAGTYGIALRGKGKSARCEGNNLWVYIFD